MQSLTDLASTVSEKQPLLRYTPLFTWTIKRSQPKIKIQRNVSHETKHNLGNGSKEEFLFTWSRLQDRITNSVSLQTLSTRKDRRTNPVSLHYKHESLNASLQHGEMDSACLETGMPRTLYTNQYTLFRPPHTNFTPDWNTTLFHPPHTQTLCQTKIPVNNRL